MDKDAAQRATQRQKELDANRARRDSELQDANRARLEYGQGIARGIRQQRESSRADFDTRTQQIAKELADTIAHVNGESARQQAERAAIQTSALTQPKLSELPTPAAVSEDLAIKTQGTFSGFAAGLIGSGSSAMDRLASESKQQTKILAAIRDNTAENDDLVLQ